MKLKTLLAPLVLTVLAACPSVPYMLEVDGALLRTTERVILRHDDYVLADQDLTAPQVSSALAESQALSILLKSSPAPASMLQGLLAPVANRHDSYVSVLELDALVRDIYLGDTESLRSLLSKASELEPGN